MQPREGVAYVSVDTTESPTAVGRYSGLEVTAPASKGLLISYLDSTTGNGYFGTIQASKLLDQDLVSIVPSFGSTSAGVQVGTAASTGTAGDGSLYRSVFVIPFVNSQGVYVPPGFSFSLVRQLANTGAAAQIGLKEVEVVNPTPSGAYLTFNVPGVAAVHSCFEIEAGPNGVLIYFIEGITIAWQIEDASRFTQDSTPYTPTCSWGTLQSTVRTGRSSTAPPALTPFTIQNTLLSSLNLQGVYVPPGKFFSAEKTTVNAVMLGSVGFVEPLA